MIFGALNGNVFYANNCGLLAYGFTSDKPAQKLMNNIGFVHMDRNGENFSGKNCHKGIPIKRPTIKRCGDILFDGVWVDSDLNVYGLHDGAAKVIANLNYPCTFLVTSSLQAGIGIEHLETFDNNSVDEFLSYYAKATAKETASASTFTAYKTTHAGFKATMLSAASEEWGDINSMWEKVVYGEPEVVTKQLSDLPILTYENVEREAQYNPHKTELRLPNSDVVRFTTVDDCAVLQGPLANYMTLQCPLNSVANSLNNMVGLAELPANMSHQLAEDYRNNKDNPEYKWIALNVVIGDSSPD